MKNLTLILSVFSIAVATTGIGAELNPLFQDNAVLQCGMRVPIWGTGRDGEAITVTFGSQRVSTTAANGQWKVLLNPMQPSATPRTLTVRGGNTREIGNVLVGDVWIASGQSNMERSLGPRPGMKPIVNGEQAVAAANYPLIREFHVEQAKAFKPQASVKGTWKVCSPSTAGDFSAVGFFFARDVFAARKVPIGIIHSSWGGTPAEAWTSEAGLQKLPGFAENLEELRRYVADPALANRETREKQNAWFLKVDPGSSPNAMWSAADLDTADWKEMTLPTYLESAGHPDFDGIIWFRRSFDMPKDWDGGEAELHLGGVDDIDSTWVNGTQVGSTIGYSQPRIYHVPGNLLKPGSNTIAVRVLDTGGNGGMYGGPDAMRLVFKSGGQSNTIPLTGSWKCKDSVSLKITGWPPQDLSQSPVAPTVLNNGMIAPLVPYGIRGVIWYQGEANCGRERQYQSLFPAMIADWRRAWGLGDFPFLFVQIAPFNGMTPELREAQLLTLKSVKNTALAVTIDCGDAQDIHPANKEPVGARLALAARALAYGEELEYSGPVYDSMKTEGANVVLNFKHIGRGLVAKEGELKGFTIAGEDKKYHPANAKILGNTIVVNASEVAHPVAVRYGWANVPEGNLFNQDGLPATPFRTDVQ